MLLRHLIMLLLMMLAGNVFAASEGALLFARNCAVCHGDHGEGGVGVPLSLASFQSSVSDHYLQQTIRLGRPGRVMPAFSHLSAAEIDSIVEHLRSWHDGPRPTFDPSPVVGDAVHGRQLFGEHCAACHGADGRGGKGTGVTLSRPRDLPIIAPALNNSGFLGSATDRMIRATLEKGREGTPMVSFLKQGLSETDLNDVVAYLRSLQPQADAVVREGPGETELVYDSPNSLEETVDAVVQAVVGRNFRLIRKQYLEDGLYPEDEVNHRQVIVYFCNFNFLYEALAIDPRVGLFLPCRVTVVETDQGVKVYAVNPKRLSVLFNNDELDKSCNTMHDLYVEILEEATF